MLPIHAAYISKFLLAAPTFRDVVDITVAVGTLLAAVFAGVATLFAARSVREASKAMRLQREAVRAQTFVNIISYEREIDFSIGMDVVRGLRDDECHHYSTFRKTQADRDKLIREVVDFLNHLAHLIRHGYVEPRHILPLYTTSINACSEKLLGKGKWLEGFRGAMNSPQYYLNFECLCNNLENLWYRNAVEWPDPTLRASQDFVDGSGDAA